ncbi:hypothetical protein J699_03651 [Acinetobacter sp. 1000160]|nr:hypothetical protein J522_3797 [Acinetobacter baumannii 146457]EYT14403.1 hypothetical protein J699_03651 [Acinetobacter sp. 1000160]
MDRKNIIDEKYNLSLSFSLDPSIFRLLPTYLDLLKIEFIGV